MFQLLTPETIKNDTAQQEREQRIRVRELSREEERLIRSINILRKDEQEEKERVYAEIAKSKVSFSTQVSILTREVEELESRKKEALKPVREIEDKAKKILDDNISKGKLLEKRMAEVDDLKDTVIEKIESFKDTEQILEERAEQITLRENGVKVAEEEVKKSISSVTDKWLQYHDAVTTLNKREESLVKRENSVKANEEANIIFKQTLDTKEKNLAERERALADKYATFISAQKEIINGQLQ